MGQNDEALKGDIVVDFKDYNYIEILMTQKARIFCCVKLLYVEASMRIFKLYNVILLGVRECGLNFVKRGVGLSKGKA